MMFIPPIVAINIRSVVGEGRLINLNSEVRAKRWSACWHIASARLADDTTIRRGRYSPASLL
jgi:hypothetical protein